MTRGERTVTGGSLSGDHEGELVAAPCAPVGVLKTVTHITADVLLVNLEPVTGTIVVLDVAGSLGHVDLERTGVLDLVVVGLESNAIQQLDTRVFSGIGVGLPRSSGDGGDLGGRTGALSILVAAECVGGNQSGVVTTVGVDAVVVATNVLPLGSHLPVQDEGVEGVVGGRNREEGGEGDGVEEHGDWWCWILLVLEVLSVDDGDERKH